MTFNLVPSLLVQLEAFAEDRARDRHLELGLKPADAADRRGAHVHPRELLPRAAAADDRRLPALRRAARASASSGGSGRAAAAAAVHRRRPARPAGLAQAGLDRSVLPRDRSRACAGWSQKGRDFTEDDKARAARGRARDPAQGDPGVSPPRRHAARSSSRRRRSITRSCRCCATRDVYLRTHPHSRMPRQRFRHPEDAAEQLRRAVALPRTRCSASRRSGSGRRKGRCRTRWCRSRATPGFAVDGDRRADPGAHASASRSDARRPRPPASSRRSLYRPYRVRAGGARDRVRVPRSRAVGSHRLHLRGWAAEAAAARLRRPAGRRRAAGTPTRTTAGRAAHPGHPRRRERLGALRGRRPAVPAGALRRAVRASGAADRDDGRGVRAARPSVLHGIFPGLVDRRDFYIWIGHADDQRAWSQLAEARQALDAPRPGGRRRGAACGRARSCSSRKAATGSGGTATTTRRSTISSSTTCSAGTCATSTARSTSRARRAVRQQHHAPSRPGRSPSRRRRSCAPTLDGEVTSYFEWLGAGSLQLRGAAGRCTRSPRAVSR